MSFLSYFFQIALDVIKAEPSFFYHPFYDSADFMAFGAGLDRHIFRVEFHMSLLNPSTRHSPQCREVLYQADGGDESRQFTGSFYTQHFDGGSRDRMRFRRSADQSHGQGQFNRSDDRPVFSQLIMGQSRISPKS